MKLKNIFLSSSVSKKDINLMTSHLWTDTFFLNRYKYSMTHPFIFYKWSRKFGLFHQCIIINSKYIFFIIFAPMAANNRILIVALLMCALALKAMAEGDEGNKNAHCTVECYWECIKIQIFTHNKCESACRLVCARRNARKVLAGEVRFLPPWV